MYRQLEKKLVKQQYLLHMSPQYGKLRPTNGWDCWPVWGTPANFNWFRPLALLLHQRRSTEVKKTLQDVWPSPGLVHYIHILRGSCRLTEFCNRFASKSYIGSITVQHSSSSREPKFVAWYKVWNYGIFTEGATYIRLDGHHIGHWPTF